jgi:hypothetical protein
LPSTKKGNPANRIARIGAWPAAVVLVVLSGGPWLLALIVVAAGYETTTRHIVLTAATSLAVLIAAGLSVAYGTSGRYGRAFWGMLAIAAVLLALWLIDLNACDSCKVD